MAQLHVVSLLDEPVGKHSAGRFHSKVVYCSTMGEQNASEHEIIPASETKYLRNMVITAQQEYLEYLFNTLREMLDRGTEINFHILLSSAYRDRDEIAACRSF